MASSQDSQASRRWQGWFRNQLDIALGTSSMQEASTASTVADLFQEASAHDVEAADAPADGLNFGRGNRSNIAAGGGTQDPPPRAVQTRPASTSVDSCEHDKSISATPKRMPHIPALPASHHQQSSGRICSETPPRWMGRACERDGSVYLADAGPVPALRYHNPSNVHPPRAVPVSVPKHNEHDPMSSTLARRYSHIGNNDVAAVPDSFSNSKVSAVMQAPDGSKDLRSSLSLGDELQQTVLGPTATISSNLRDVPLPFIMDQSSTPTPSSASTIGTGPSVSRTLARSSATRGGAHSHGSKEFSNYPLRSLPLPEGLSRQQICQNYPNHLHGDTLMRVVYGRGVEHGLWTGKDIWDACPVDGRNHATNSRPHNYLEQRIRRAEVEALDAGQALPRQKRTRKNCGEASPDGSDDLQMAPPAKRNWPMRVSDDGLQPITKPALLNTSSHDNYPSRAPQVRQSIDNGWAAAETSRATFRSPRSDASVQIDGDSRAKDVGLDPLALIDDVL